MLKTTLGMLLLYGGACISMAAGVSFPGEREWVSKLGSVVTGSFLSCTESKVALRVNRQRVEIPLERLDEGDTALVKSLATPTARRDIKLAETLWPFIMQELEQVSWTPVQKDISPLFNAADRKLPSKSMTRQLKVDGVACKTSDMLLSGRTVQARQSYYAEEKTGSTAGRKYFSTVLRTGTIISWHDRETGLLEPYERLLENRTRMRGPIASLLPEGTQLAAYETRRYSNPDMSLVAQEAPVKGSYETCRPASLSRKAVEVYWDKNGQMVCGVLRLEYDNARLALLFDARKKLIDAPGLGYAVMLSRMSKKSRDPNVKDAYYYHVGLTADGLPVYHHEGKEDEDQMDPLRRFCLSDSVRKKLEAEERSRSKELRSQKEARRRLVESARKKGG